jgi:hypothetical protein
MDEIEARIQAAMQEPVPVGRLSVAGRTFNFHSNTSVFCKLATFYHPYYVIESGNFVSPTASVYGLLLKGEEDKPPITNMSEYLASPLCVARKERKTIYWHQRISSWIISDRGQRRIIVTATNFTELELQLRVLLRDQLFEVIETKLGALFLHGAAVEKLGKVNIFLGPRNSGKTVSVLSLMLYFNFRFVFWRSSKYISFTK